jgi:choline-sulfatase
LNILFVMANQMTPFMLRTFGGVGARTANMSALAERGVVFQTAFTPSPIYAPRPRGVDDRPPGLADRHL